MKYYFLLLTVFAGISSSKVVHADELDIDKFNEHYIQISSASTGECIEVPRGGNEDWLKYSSGIHLQTAQCDQDLALLTQGWFVKKIGGEIVSLSSAYSGGTQVMDLHTPEVSRPSFSEHERIQTYASLPERLLHNQGWVFELVAEDTYKIRSALTHMCLSRSASTPAFIEQQTCSSAVESEAYQLWRVTEIPTGRSFDTSTSLSSTTISIIRAAATRWNGERVQIRSAFSGKCLDVDAANVTRDGLGNGATVQQWQCLADRTHQNQGWALTEVSPGVLTIQGLHSRNLLDLPAGDLSRDGYEENIPLQMWQGIAERALHNQGWSFKPVEGGKYIIFSRHSHKCLAVSNRSNGDRAVQKACDLNDESIFWTVYVAPRPVIVDRPAPQVARQRSASPPDSFSQGGGNTYRKRRTQRQPVQQPPLMRRGRTTHRGSLWQRPQGRRRGIHFD